MSDVTGHLDLRQRVRVLRQAHEAIDPVAQSDEWALSAFRLGVAASEVAVRPDDVRAPMELLQKAAMILDEHRAPLEHARILTALAACQRAVGDSHGAIEHFRRALGLMHGRVSPVEEGTAHSNLGQALTELGRADLAIEHLDRAVALIGQEPSAALEQIDTDVLNDEARRVLLAALINRGSALQGLGSGEDLAKAMDDYRFVIDATNPEEAPLQAGMAHHALGTVQKALGDLDAALSSFERSNQILTPTTFPMQHAIGRFNTAITAEARGTLADLRRAYREVGVALGIFDQRLHRAQWESAFDVRQRIVAELLRLAPEMSLSDHEVMALVEVDPVKRASLVRDFMRRIDRLPRQQRADELLNFFDSACRHDRYGDVINVMMPILMELPDALLADALSALVASHLEQSDRDRLDALVDDVVQEVLHGPQRVRVRDVLEHFGWNRP
ncbi:MAG: tetratricopeptide repeat protein [Ilumatobacteraceae bacterium]